MWLNFIINIDFIDVRDVLKEAVQLSDKLRLFNSKFYHEFDGVDNFWQKWTLLAWGAF